VLLIRGYTHRIVDDDDDEDQRPSNVKSECKRTSQSTHTTYRFAVTRGKLDHHRFVSCKEVRSPSEGRTMDASGWLNLMTDVRHVPPVLALHSMSEVSGAEHRGPDTRVTMQYVLSLRTRGPIVGTLVRKTAKPSKLETLSRLIHRGSPPRGRGKGEWPVSLVTVTHGQPASNTSPCDQSLCALSPSFFLTNTEH
jgi:hypothetical protein